MSYFDVNILTETAKVPSHQRCATDPYGHYRCVGDPGSGLVHSYWKWRLARKGDTDELHFVRVRKGVSTQTQGAALAWFSTGGNSGKLWYERDRFVKLDVSGDSAVMQLVNNEEDGTVFTYDTAVQQWGEVASCMSFDFSRPITGESYTRSGNGVVGFTQSSEWPHQVRGDDPMASREFHTFVIWELTADVDGTTYYLSRGATESLTGDPALPGESGATSWQEINGESRGDLGRYLTSKRPPRWDTRDWNFTRPPVERWHGARYGATGLDMKIFYPAAVNHTRVPAGFAYGKRC